jgi:His/Glu/Gln/Arg/opine family amino acid ABC transporter permease subunit
MLESLLDEIPRFFTYYNGLFLLQGMLTTLLLSAAGVTGGGLVGSALALVRIGSRPLWLPLRVAAIVYVETLRRIPFLVTLMLVFFGFRFLRVDLNAFFVSVVAVMLISAAYLAEIVRAGIQSVDPGQNEAAEALGLTRGQTLRRIVLPQAMRVIVPPTGNETIAMLKDTSLLLYVPVTAELFFQLDSIGKRTFQIFPMYVAACLWYLALTSVLLVGQYFLEKRFSRGYGSAEKARLRLRGMAAEHGGAVEGGGG